METEIGKPIDEKAVAPVDMIEGDKVHLLSGGSLETYIITHDSGSSVICVNGTAARHARAGDNLTLVSCYTASKE